MLRVLLLVLCLIPLGLSVGCTPAGGEAPPSVTTPGE
jgi:hypothetical protein